jgi:hypothetical protein
MIFSAVPLRVFSRLWSHAEHLVLRRAAPLLPFVSGTAEMSGTITPRGRPAAAGRRGDFQAG